MQLQPPFTGKFVPTSAAHKWGPAVTTHFWTLNSDQEFLNYDVIDMCAYTIGFSVVFGKEVSVQHLGCTATPFRNFHKIKRSNCRSSKKNAHLAFMQLPPIFSWQFLVAHTANVWGPAVTKHFWTLNSDQEFLNYDVIDMCECMSSKKAHLAFMQLQPPFTGKFIPHLLHINGVQQ